MATLRIVLFVVAVAVAVLCLGAAPAAAIGAGGVGGVGAVWAFLALAGLCALPGVKIGASFKGGKEVVVELEEAWWFSQPLNGGLGLDAPLHATDIAEAGFFPMGMVLEEAPEVLFPVNDDSFSAMEFVAWCNDTIEVLSSWSPEWEQQDVLAGWMPHTLDTLPRVTEAMKVQVVSRRALAQAEAFEAYAAKVEAWQAENAARLARRERALACYLQGAKLRKEAMARLAARKAALLA